MCFPGAWCVGSSPVSSRRTAGPGVALGVHKGRHDHQYMSPRWAWVVCEARPEIVGLCLCPAWLVHPIGRMRHVVRTATILGIVWPPAGDRHVQTWCHAAHLSSCCARVQRQLGRPGHSLFGCAFLCYASMSWFGLDGDWGRLLGQVACVPKGRPPRGPQPCWRVPLHGCRTSLHPLGQGGHWHPQRPIAGRREHVGNIQHWFLSTTVQLMRRGQVPLG